MIALLLYLASIVAANWAIVTFGPVPVGFGLLAPAGVYFVGVTFTLRDVVQEQVGRRGVWGAVCAGALLSALINPALALASGAAFLLSESADMLVYTPLRRRNLVAAVLLSNTVGLVVDSVCFLALAFGSLAYLPGQIVGKAWMTVLFLPVIWAVSRWQAARRVVA